METIMMTSKRPSAVMAAAAVLIAGPAIGADIGYISGASGYLVGSVGDIAITAAWAGQAPIGGSPAMARYGSTAGASLRRARPGSRCGGRTAGPARSRRSGPWPISD